MQNRYKIDISTSTIIKVALAILLVWFIFAIREIIVLFFVVIIIVAALSPLVNKMSKKIPRVLSVILLLVLFLAILAGIGFLVVPPLIFELKQLAINLPILLNRFGPIYQNLQNNITNYQESLFNASSQLGQITSNIYSTTLGFFSGIIAFFTTIVLVVYMLLEKDSIQKILHQLIPAQYHEKTVGILQKISDKMGSWLGGHLFLMIIVGLLDGIALTSLGVPYVLVLAVWGGLMEVIPYIGPWLGLAPAIIIAFTISPIKAILVIVVYLVIQQLESQFLAPKILRKAVGLSPVIIILSLLVGAKLMGILGMIISVPVAAALSVLIQEWPEIKKLRA